MDSEVADLLLHVVLQGLLYSLVVMGVYLSSRVIAFDDLTTEGSFGIGGALAAVVGLMGVSGWLALPAAMAGGLLSGAATAWLHTKLKMNNLISGLVVTTALFSVCLKLAGSNAALPSEACPWASWSLPPRLSSWLVIGAVVTMAYMSVRMLLRSEIGLVLRALGNNPQVVISLGKSVDGYKIAGLAIANGLTAIAGALFVLWNGFFSITASVGTLVIGLAGLILGEVIHARFSWGLIAGAILYQALFALTIELELDPVWNNLVKAVLIVLLIQIGPKPVLVAQR